MASITSPIVSSLSPHKIANSLIDAEDPLQAVQALPEQDFFLLIKRIGIEDSLELLALASQQQWQACLDLDVWLGDRVNVPNVHIWLNALLHIGYEKLGEIWQSVDPELTALVLQRDCEIFDLSLGEEPYDHDDRTRITTPDTFFILVVKEDDPEKAKWLNHLVDFLYRFDQRVARLSIMAARSELPAQLEENAYRWRSGRVADLGFTEYFDALKIFAPIDIASVTLDEGTSDQFTDLNPASPLPAIIASQSEESFLRQALNLIESKDSQIATSKGLMVLANNALSALRVTTSDDEAMTAAIKSTMATLSLGLEHLSGGEAEVGVKALQQVAISRIHRVGVALIRKVANAARTLVSNKPAFSGGDKQILEGLTRFMPAFAESIDEPGSLAFRPIESKGDLSTIAIRLTEMAAGASLLKVILGDSDVGEASVADCISTALLTTALDQGEAKFRFLSKSDLAYIAAWKMQPERWLKTHQAFRNLIGKLNIGIAEGIFDSLLLRHAKRAEEIVADIDVDANPKFLSGLLFQ